MSLTIAGTSTRFVFTAGSIVQPFSGVNILDSLQDPNAFGTQVVTVTITDIDTGAPTDADGTFAITSATRFIVTHTAPGVYVLNRGQIFHAASTASSDLADLKFTPSTTPGTALIKLDIVDNLNQTVSDNHTSVVNAIPPTNFTVSDQTTGLTRTSAGTGYIGPVAGLKSQYIVQSDNANLTPDNLNISAVTPNVFIHSGPGTDGIDVSKSNGNNILDGSTGSNFLTGGTGLDTFYLDNRSPGAPIFSTIVNFHAGDNATVFGVNPTDFSMLKLDNQGAAGFTGLDLIFSAPGHVDTSFVLSGYTSADLLNGRLTMNYGTTPDLPGLPGSQYLTVHAN